MKVPENSRVIKVDLDWLGSGSKLHEMALKFYVINRTIEQNLFELLSEYNGFLTEV